VLLPRHSSLAGALRPWPAVLVVWGPGGETARHSHHCWHLLLGLDAELRVALASTRQRRAAAVLTPPDLPHATDARGTRVVVAFVAPESDAGAQLLARHGRSRALFFGPEDGARLRELLAPAVLAGSDPLATVSLALGLGGEPIRPPASAHPAIRRVLRWLAEAPPHADTSLAALAARAGLSRGRFMHAFTATTGVPLRPYLRWLKLQRAGGAIAGGATLGDAAHAAGFADAAHMTRTFRRMFGVVPSQLRRDSQSVQAP
jgi:AraC-like DNA-binding protein